MDKKYSVYCLRQNQEELNSLIEKALFIVIAPFSYSKEKLYIWVRRKRE